MKYIIGLNAIGINTSATLLKDGKIVGAIEEERLLPLLKSLMISAKHVDNMDIALQTIIDPRTPIPFESRDVVSDLSDMLGIKYCAYPQPEININEEFDDDMVGYGFATKVSEDCTLGMNSGSLTPPPLP